MCMAWLNTPAMGPQLAQSEATCVAASQMKGHVKPSLLRPGALALVGRVIVLSLRIVRKVLSVSRGRFVGAWFRKGRLAAHMTHSEVSRGSVGHRTRVSSVRGMLSWLTQG